MGHVTKVSPQVTKVYANHEHLLSKLVQFWHIPIHRSLLIIFEDFSPRLNFCQRAVWPAVAASVEKKLAVCHAHPRPNWTTVASFDGRVGIQGLTAARRRFYAWQQRSWFLSMVMSRPRSEGLLTKLSGSPVFWSGLPPPWWGGILRDPLKFFLLSSLNINVGSTPQFKRKAGIKVIVKSGCKREERICSYFSFSECQMNASSQPLNIIFSHALQSWHAGYVHIREAHPASSVDQDSR